MRAHDATQLASVSSAHERLIEFMPLAADGSPRATVSELRAPLVASLDRRESFAWWEFESEEKRRLALDVLMRKMFR